MSDNPFASSRTKPGQGEVILSASPPHAPRLSSCSYQYPLKLIAPDPLHVEDGSLVHTVYLLSYGGGLVAGDTIGLVVRMGTTARLILLTQGSTKIFTSPSADVVARQTLEVELAEGGALCYLPDPVQPFANSAFAQTQIYRLPGLDTADFCVCDWVCRGRTARGEDWDFRSYTSQNEVWLAPGSGGRRLLLRDNVLLGSSLEGGGFRMHMHRLGVFGTLVIHGPRLKSLGQFFMQEFDALPRVGARDWDGEREDGASSARQRRAAQERKDELLWTAARVRGLVLVKFGAREVEGAKRWLLDMLRFENLTEEIFGERALMCLKS